MLLNNLRLFLFLILFSISSNCFGQCFEIETILVAACDSGGATPDEGFNEMVRFKVGPTAINTSTMTVNFPSNTWQGLIQNGVTAAKVLQLNTQIAALGGCAQLLEPTGGVLPANAKVILVTSQNFSVSANVFGPISQNMYIIFQNNTTQTGGHFGNYGSSTTTTNNRTLVINFGTCSDTVTYDRSLLVTTTGVPGGGNGSSVNFTPAGVASYINLGCFAPIDPFTADAGTVLTTPCAGTTVNLVGLAQGYTAVQWSATSGTFGSANSLSSTYTIPTSASGNIQLTLTATNACGATVSDLVVFSVSASFTPDFAPTLSLCSGATAPVLNVTSPNGISGTWNPSTINNTTGNTYVFTPTSGQCATTANTVVSITAQTTPNFATTLALCSGATAPALNATSPNGISGTWNPSTINNTTGNTYVFTPTSGQCATTTNTIVSITAQTTPNFATTLALCSGATAPTLNATSPNGISGTWSPSTISNTNGNTYVFTPTAGQCATTANTVVSVSASFTPDFAPTLSLCSGATAPVLNATSPNGISGTWNPSTINNTTGNTYVFTPTAGQCATTVNTVVSVSSSIIPDFATTLALCSGATAPALNATSPNGISGTWNPATISNTSGNTYVFTPTAGQCATTTNTIVSITAQTTPNFVTTLALCTGATAPTLNATSPNGISGTWSPSTISNTTGNTYVFTPTSGQCATTTNTIVSITAQTTPNFATTLALCSGATAPTLNATSPNGISGTWNPSTINNTTGNTYVFTPTAGQCATTFNTVVSVSSSIFPDFATTLALCSGATAPVLNATSPNGISGTWNPSTINNTTGNTYVFTPTAGQCATTFNTVVSVSSSIIPDFTPTLSLCSGSTAPTLNATSPNGISGTWNPATINNTTGNTYVFTPTAGQCATTANTVVSVSSSIIPDFAPTLALCSGATTPVLNATSPNGISGTWNPSTINNTTGNTYVFTPTSGQCANSVNTVVTISPSSVQTATYSICLNAAGQAISPTLIDTGLLATDYVFVWTKDGNPLSDSTPAIFASAVGSYVAQATNLVTNCIVTLNATVQLVPKATASATVNSDFDSAQLISVLVVGGQGPYNFQLNGGPTQLAPDFTIYQGGDYQIHITEPSGCNVLDLEVNALFYPKFFTPNGDGFNDTWNINGDSLQDQSELYVFDRMGKLLKQLAPNGPGWNGTFNGHPLPSSDYWFLLKYISTTGQAKEYKANFSLKR